MGANKEHFKEPWLRLFKEVGTIGVACERIKIDRDTIRRWRNNDPEFERKFIEADTHITETLERSAMARALRQSDTLLIFLLKSRRPDIYKERIQQEVDPKTIDLLVTQFISAVKKHSPEFCPHCKSHLGLQNKIAMELKSLSDMMTNA